MFRRRGGCVVDRLIDNTTRNQGGDNLIAAKKVEIIMVTNLGNYWYEALHRYYQAQACKGPVNKKDFFIVVPEKDFLKFMGEDDFNIFRHENPNFFISPEIDGEPHILKLWGATLLRSPDLKSNDVRVFCNDRR
jgi:hypothetical protein